MLNIKDLSVEDAKLIYRKDYWDRAGCDALDWPLCLVHFDACVNLGLAKTTELKAKAFNWTDYLFMRIEHYSNLRKPEYLRGWIKWVDRVVGYL